MEIRLDGKAALVTGAGRGIGRAIALELAGSGADVAVNYHTSRAEAEQVCGEIKRMGRQTVSIGADVADADQVCTMVSKTAQAFNGRLDILVNNAGIYPIQKSVDLSDAEWDRVLNVNLRGAFITSREAAKEMIRRGAGGRIICIASGAGHAGRPGQTHYCASKAGLILLCKSLAIDFAPHGINVNSISVGFVEVDHYDSPDLEPVKRDILKRILLRRPGLPEDVAKMAVFLASNHADWITGADFRVDGGESAGRVPEADF
jgi:NAD(P)-dependent dehydrogenase (short-subunit alcohol dehydrogenase family)